MSEPFFINLAKRSSNNISGRGLKLPILMFKKCAGNNFKQIMGSFFCIHEMAVFLIHNVNSCHGNSIN